MSDSPEDMTAEQVEGLRKILALNAEHANQRFTDLAAEWGLGGIRHQLDEFLGGLRAQDRPEVATGLAAALGAYLDQFGPTGVVGQAETFRDHS